MNQSELEDWMVARVADILKIPVEEVRVDEEFANLGLNSVHAVTLTGELEDQVGKDIDPSLVFEYPSIRALSEHIATL